MKRCEKTTLILSNTKFNKNKESTNMKRINILRLIGSTCLLLGSIINILNLNTDISFALRICLIPLLLTSIISYAIALIMQIKNNKKDKND